ncbi:MAG: hypothetical protein R2695_10975 [Acidimicrobiales bacterium]
MASEPRVTPYGAWSSPITAASLVQGAVGISEVLVDPADPAAVWWAESRPDEGGRAAVMRLGPAGPVELTPADANVRTTVHEYGGGAWWPHGGALFWVDFADQRLRRTDADGSVTLLTPEPTVARGGATPTAGSPPTAGSWCACGSGTTPAGNRPTSSWPSPPTARWRSRPCGRAPTS